jgi:thiol peroxidase
VKPEARTVFIGAQPSVLCGPELAVGDAAPDFELWQYVDQTPCLINRELLLGYQMPVLFCCLHSVDTRVGAILVSSDLPFTQNRYATKESLSFLSVASDYRASFGRAFGVYLPELMFLTRSVIVTDAEATIQHIDIVTEFTDEPDYDAAINAVAELL